MDVERAGKAVKDIQGYFKRLEELNLEDSDKIKDKKDYYAASMILFSICNRAFDLGEILIRSKGIGLPTSYRDIFKILYEEKFIDKDLNTKFSDLVHYRNAIAHEYQDVAKDDLFKLYGLIDVVKALVVIIQKEINE